MPWHSWNSSHRISNWLLVNLPRHADHHFNPARQYYLLRHSHNAPQLPTGYFGLFLLPLIPPLWRSIMDPRVKAWRSAYGSHTSPIIEGEKNEQSAKENVKRESLHILF
jgi:alkane 1-monooxygenase